MWLFLFQFVGVAVVLGGAAGLGLRAWDKQKPARDAVLIAKSAETAE